MGETISKIDNSTIEIMSIIPQQTVRERVTIQQIEENIKGLNEEIEMLNQTIANEENNSQKIIREAKEKMESKKAELDSWLKIREESNKLGVQIK